LFISPCQFERVNSAASTIATLDEGRRQPRTHLFVAATLYCGGGAAPVRIRNMSPSGVLVEGPALPEPLTPVTLKRGSLKISGEVAWKAGQKAGIAFSTTVDVGAWMSRQPSSDQARIDAIVSDFKTGSGAHGSPHTAEPLPGGNSLETELLALHADLVRLGNSLVNDPDLIADHPEVQMLDISVQRIDRMIGRLRDG
jgi:hypothetical protein